MDGGFFYKLFTTPLGYYFFETIMKENNSNPNIQHILTDLTITDSKLINVEKDKHKIATILPYSSDNYSYCFHGDTTDIFFDFGDSSIVKYVDTKDRKIVIFLTHYHHDHTGGIYDYENKAKIYGSPKSQIKDVIVKDLEVFHIDQFEILCIHTPCHTRDHICYRVLDTRSNKKFLISGDCIFLAGAGKFFEGSGQEMVDSIEKLFKHCDGDEILLGGHEYALSNLRFSIFIDPNNKSAKEKYEWCLQRRENNLITYGFSTLSDEKKYNPFFRWDEKEIREKSKLDDSGKILEWIRGEKNSFDSKKK